MPTTPNKFLAFAELATLGRQWRQTGLTIAWTNGCFDLLHVGHVRSLQAARHLADLLVVGVNSDASVQRLKGRGRPLVPAAERMELLAALACVDRVVQFDEDTPQRCLELLQPHFHCKGADYGPGGKAVPESRTVTAYGGQVVFLPMVEQRSSTDLLTRLRSGKASEPV